LAATHGRRQLRTTTRAPALSTPPVAATTRLVPDAWPSILRRSLRHLERDDAVLPRICAHGKLWVDSTGDYALNMWQWRGKDTHNFRGARLRCISFVWGRFATGARWIG
jgi:hypothetical protein